MLKTIEVEINAEGQIRPIDQNIDLPVGRALLTLLTEQESSVPTASIQSIFDDLFGILSAQRGVTLEEMQQAIQQQAQRHSKIKP